MEHSSKISRANGLLLAVFAVFLIFAWRLGTIQIEQHDAYTALATAQQTSSQTLKASRGEIFAKDEDGEIAPLVMNETVYDVVVSPSLYFSDDGSSRKNDDYNSLKSTLTDIIGADNVTDGAFDSKFIGTSQYDVVAKQVSRDTAQKIKDAVTKKDLPGVTLSPESKRVYIEGTMAAQTLGFVNADGVGQYGVEQALNTELTGTNGLLESVRDARNNPLTIGVNDVDIPAKNGDNVVLTLDRNVQSEVEDDLQSGLESVGASEGSAVVMDPQSGAILAMANYPTYDPANYGKVTDAEVFQNRVVSYAYEPGSVLKSLAMAAALDTGAVTPDTTYTDEGCTQVEDAKICNASRQVDGETFNMANVLGWSLNTGLVWVLRDKMGGGDITLQARQTIYNYYTDHFQLGKKTGIAQTGEAAGTIQKPDTPNGAKVVYSNMVFGQGLNVTNLQVAAAFSAAINGGTYYHPYLLAGTYNDDKFVAEKAKDPIKNVLNHDKSEELKEMLYEARKVYAVNTPNDQGFYVGGKTGTAQIYNPNGGGYEENTTVGTYVGYGADKTKTPKYVIMVRIDPKPGQNFGGTDAQAIFNKISNYMISYMGLSKP
jgi:cell division protein FtsI/penicillin-binding protein 2